MIPHEEIEFTLAMAQKGIRAEAPAKVMEELCRVYLAWLDAPEVEVQEWFLPNSIETLVRADGLEKGKRVRLVEAPDVGG